MKPNVSGSNKHLLCRMSGLNPWQFWTIALHRQLVEMGRFDMVPSLDRGCRPFLKMTSLFKKTRGGLPAMLRRRNVNRSTQRLGLLAHNYGNPQIFSFLFIFFHRAARMGKLNAKRPLAPRNVVLSKTFFYKAFKTPP